MASMKRLREYLEDQQEPFALHVYLVERGLWFRSPSLAGTNGCCLMNSCKTLKKPCRYSTSKRIVDFTKKLNSILCKPVASGAKIFFNKKQSNWAIEKISSGIDGLSSFESLSGDYPPSDYDNGSSVAESFQSFSLMEPKQDETKPNSTCKTDNKQTMRRPCLSDLQQAWRLWEDLLLNCKKGKFETTDMECTRPVSVLWNQNWFLATNRSKMQKRGALEELKKPQKTITNKFSLSWRIRLRSFANSESQTGFEDWSFYPEEYKEISREIGDVIMDDIVQEMFLSF